MNIQYPEDVFQTIKCDFPEAKLKLHVWNRMSDEEKEKSREKNDGYVGLSPLNDVGWVDLYSDKKMDTLLARAEECRKKNIFGEPQKEGGTNGEVLIEYGAKHPAPPWIVRNNVQSWPLYKYSTSRIYRVPMIDFVDKPSVEKLEEFEAELRKNALFSGSVLYYFDSTNSYHGIVNVLCEHSAWAFFMSFLVDKEVVDQDWIKIGLNSRRANLRWTASIENRQRPSFFRKAFL